MHFSLNCFWEYKHRIMLFCPPNTTFTDFWDDGVSQCFMETVSSLVLLSFLLVFGTIQMVIYWRYAMLNSTFTRNACTCMYKFQVFLLIFFPTLVASRFVLMSFVYENHQILGYLVSWFTTRLQRCFTASTFQLLTTSLTVFNYMFIFGLLYKERHYQLPSTPSRGHGLVLLTFWTLSFVNENLSFINMRDNEWWFDYKT